MESVSRRAIPRSPDRVRPRRAPTAGRSSASAACLSRCIAASTAAGSCRPGRVRSQTRSDAATSAKTKPAFSALTSTGTWRAHSAIRARSTSITGWYSSRRSSSFWETRSAADLAARQSPSPTALLSASISRFIWDFICGEIPLMSAPSHACPNAVLACSARSRFAVVTASKTPATVPDKALSLAGTGPCRVSVGDATDTASNSPPGVPVENSPYPGAKTFPSVVPSMCSSITSMAPLISPLGPWTDWSIFSTRTCSNTTPGAFSAR